MHFNESSGIHLATHLCDLKIKGGKCDGPKGGR